MQDWKDLIDRGADLCGGQNALARKLGTTSGALASCKAGKRSMPEDQIRVLAELLEENPAELWMAQMQRRNPFLRAAATAAACLVGGVILSASLPSEVRASTLYQTASHGEPSVYYVKSS